MSFDFLNNNVGMSNGNVGAPIPQQYYNQNNMYQQPMMMQQPKPIDPRQFETPEITIGEGLKFTVIDGNKSSSNPLAIPVDNTPDSAHEKNLPAAKKKSTSGIIRSNDEKKTLSGEIDDVPTAYTYMETTGMLRETLAQIDGLNSELMQEFESVRTSRTIKNKYGLLADLSENVGSLISNKIAAIKEINNSISKSNELDYKRIKDMKIAQGNVDDDKHIADLYTAFITNPQAQSQYVQVPMMDMTSYGSTGIVRATIDNNGNTVGNGDMSYTNYIANATPEQRLMLMEGNNNIKQCLVFDPETGGKAFQYYDLSTNQPIPNMPTYSDMLLEEFTIDLANNVAKSLNMKETMPLVVVNKNSIVSNY